MIIDTEIVDVKIVEPRVFNDDRGFFFEAFNINTLKSAGIDFVPVQENCAFSLKKGISLFKISIYLLLESLPYSRQPIARNTLVASALLSSERIFSLLYEGAVTTVGM